MKAILTLIRTGWQYAQGRRLWMLLYGVMFIVANVVLLLEPYVVGKMLNTIQQITEHEDPLRALLFWFGCLVSIQALFWAFHGPARVIENVLAFHIQVAFVDRLYNILTALPAQWHKDNHSGQTINRIRKSSNALYNFMRDSFQGIEMILKLVGSIIAISILFPVAGAIAVAMCLVTFAVIVSFDKILLPQYEEINEREHFTASALHDYVTNIFTVISLRLEKMTRSEVYRRMTCYLPLYKKNHKINETKWFLVTMSIAVMTVVVLSWYAMSMLNAGDVLLAGTVFMLYQYLHKMGAAFFTFAWKYSATIEQYADLRSTDEIFAAAPAQKTETRLPKNWQRIHIDKLTFSYEDEDHHRHHVDNLSVVLTRGKNIALVGQSGSGKSTLMHLIRGLHVTDQVDVTCDNTKLPEGLAPLSHSTTLIPQEPEIFSNTIEYNVSVDTDQSKVSLMEDIRDACFAPVLERLPKGLDTDVSEKGVNLSGGEKQRLALARGIFAAKKSDIILLDEPTSSVDTVNELQIHKNIFKRFKDRCIVASIHRLHLLPLFDEVYVLKDGKIVEEGTPDELMNGTGLLAEMWETYQAEQNNH